MVKRRRGRPTGYKLSTDSKKAISEAKKGQRHSQETKDKISKTLIKYFRRKNPLSEEIINRYCRINDDELCDWLYDNSDNIDSYTDIRTDRNLSNINKTEIVYGHNIELFSHDLTPEVILIYKEYCIENNIDLDIMSMTGGKIDGRTRIR